MQDWEENDDVDELLPAARTLMDRLDIVRHAQTLKYAGILTGLSVSLLAAAGFGYLTFGRHPLDIRFIDEIDRLSPLLLIASIYAMFLFSLAYYRSSIERLRISVAQRRLGEAITEAVELGSSG